MIWDQLHHGYIEAANGETGLEQVNQVWSTEDRGQ